MSYVDPNGLSAFLACHLIALNKWPVADPVGICKMARHIISKAVLFAIKDDILEAASPLQLCAGKIAGIEAAIHAVKTSFQNDDRSNFCWLMPCQ